MLREVDQQNFTLLASLSRLHNVLSRSPSFTPRVSSNEERMTRTDIFDEQAVEFFFKMLVSFADPTVGSQIAFIIV